MNHEANKIFPIERSRKKKRQRLWNCQRKKTKPLHDILHEEKYNTGVLNVNSDWPQSPGKYLTSLPEDKRTLAQAVSRLIGLCEAQLPQGNKAALWLSITALVQGQPSPECRRFPSHIITLMKKNISKYPLSTVSLEDMVNRLNILSSQSDSVTVMPFSNKKQQQVRSYLSLACMKWGYRFARLYEIHHSVCQEHHTALSIGWPMPY